jgi:hypothetical protein
VIYFPYEEILMKKTKLIITALFALNVMAVLMFSGCEKPDPEYTIKYEITGPATVAKTIYYTNETNSYDNLNDVQIPWTKTITIIGKKYIECSFIIPGNSINSYTLNLYVNGNIKKTASSNSSAIVRLSL